ncbi:hypothetical protein DL96DRAFT_1623287 [Flagelloscypha sp. PMI_526]|nr:hypothetical protein DL96DRAFT_1623287 [Flagelloscypha sp. PMI_526]
MEVDSGPRFPPEILQRIVSFIQDPISLRRCGRSCLILVQVAQQKLFHTVTLRKDPHHLSRLREVVTTSPHIASYIRSIAVIPEQAGTIELLGRLSNLRELGVGTAKRSIWPPSLFENVLLQSVFQNLTALVIDNADIPLVVITTCTRLISLTLINSGIFYPELLKKITENHSCKSLKILTLDGTRNFDGGHSSITALVVRGYYPSLSCLRIPVGDVIQRGRFPETDLATMLEPLRPNLRCLDVDFWDIWSDSILLTEGNSFFIGRFSNLDTFRISIMHVEDQWRERRHCALGHLGWLTKMFQGIIAPHPLSTLILADVVCDPEELADESIRAAWASLDEALHSSFAPNELLAAHASPKLPRLSKVVIPLDQYFKRFTDVAVSVFKQPLAVSYSTGKLSFEKIEIEEVFWSMPDSS